MVNIKTWGFICYYNDNKPNKKLVRRQYKAILIGYRADNKTYKSRI